MQCGPTVEIHTYYLHLVIFHLVMIKHKTVSGRELQTGNQQPARSAEHGQPISEHLPQQNIPVSEE